jgi:hypothetical protein
MTIPCKPGSSGWSARKRCTSPSGSTSPEMARSPPAIGRRLHARPSTRQRRALGHDVLPAPGWCRRGARYKTPRRVTTVALWLPPG